VEASREWSPRQPCGPFGAMRCSPKNQIQPEASLRLLFRRSHPADFLEDPSTWTLEEMHRWLRARGLLPDEHATREELLERIKANLRPPPRAS
ncbi:hypothetical protein AOCH_003502, partial [Aspergillus ochraceoroseus]